MTIFINNSLIVETKKSEDTQVPTIQKLYET
jgi:hypothetical protein